ncbi:hypothetical protein DITRI_Ditri13aG0017300 [Diplodiscus trichospermus]
MGGGAMHVELPQIQFNSSSFVVPAVSSSSSSSTNNLNLPIPSNHTAPPRRPSSSSSSSSSCQNEISKKIEATDGKENKTLTGFFNNFVLGPVPSKSEVENAVSALQNFMHEISLSRPELRWMQPVLNSCDSRLLLSQGITVYDAFILLLSEPSIKRLVVSLSSDKAVWDAIMNNEVVRKLCDFPQPAVENGRAWNSTAEADLGNNDILQWILDMAKTKVTELVLKFLSLLNEVLRREKPDEQTRDHLDEKIRSSLLLSIVILLIVIVARVQMV